MCVFKLIEDSPLLGRKLVRQITKAPYLQEQWFVNPFGGLFVSDLGSTGHGKEMAALYLPSEFQSSKIDPVSFHSLPCSLAGVRWA